MLCFVREGFPTHRPDVDILFGKELVERRGNFVDFVMQAADEAQGSGAVTWYGRTVWVGSTDTGNSLLHRGRRLFLGLWHNINCLRLTSASNYDAIQVRDMYLFAIIALMYARKRKTRFFFWLSWPEPESQLLRARSRTAQYPFLTLIRGHLSGWLLYRHILPHCDHVFVQSEQMKSDICRHGIGSGRVSPVPMGVDISMFPAVTIAAPAPGCRRQYQIGYLGVISAERHLDVLVDMLALLRSHGLPAKLLIVGDGQQPSDRDQIEKRARDLGVLDHVQITGFLPRSQALERIRSSDVCVSPFFPNSVLKSTSPTKLVEYMALGIPVIANSHPEQQLVLRQSRGGVCTPWGAGHFARAARWLLQLSDADRLAMGRRGQEWVAANRDYRQIAERLEHKYLKILFHHGAVAGDSSLCGVDEHD